MIVILKTIQISKGRFPRWVLPAHTSTVGMEVPLQSHRSQRQARFLPIAVQIAHGIEQPILLVDQAIHRVGRSISVRHLISHLIVISIGVQFLDRLKYRAGQILGRPFPQPPQALRELARRGGVITMPGAFENLFAQLAPTTISNLQDSVQEAQDQGDGWKQALPGQPRRFEPVRTNTLRGVVRIEFLRLLFELAVGLRERGSAFIPGDGRSQKTAFADRRGDQDFRPMSQVTFSSATNCAGNLSGALTVVPSSELRPKLSHIRCQ